MVVYLDYIVTYKYTFEEHIEKLKKELQVFPNNEFYIKLEKCEFSQHEVPCWVIYYPRMVCMDEAKV